MRTLLLFGISELVVSDDSSCCVFDRQLMPTPTTPTTGHFWSVSTSASSLDAEQSTTMCQRAVKRSLTHWLLLHHAVDDRFRRLRAGHERGRVGRPGEAHPLETLFSEKLVFRAARPLESSSSEKLTSQEAHPPRSSFSGKLLPWEAPPLESSPYEKLTFWEASSSRSVYSEKLLFWEARPLRSLFSEKLVLLEARLRSSSSEKLTFWEAHSLRSSSQEKLIFCALYLLIGLALLAMCFELIQEEVWSRRKCVCSSTRSACVSACLTPPRRAATWRPAARDVAAVDSDRCRDVGRVDEVALRRPRFSIGVGDQQPASYPGQFSLPPRAGR